MNDLINFTYTDKSGKVSERNGEVIPNHKNISPEKFITIREANGQVRSFDLSRVHVVAIA